jgi:hypothetical protein
MLTALRNQLPLSHQALVHKEDFMSPIKIIAPFVFALLPSAALAQEKPAFSFDHHIINIRTDQCLDRARFTLIQFHAGEIAAGGGAVGSGLSEGGTVVVHCLSNGNPAQSWLVVVTATAPGPLAGSLRERFVRQFHANIPGL